jgi:hemolysin III
MVRKRLNELPIEEVANTITHGLGLVLSVIGFCVLAVMAVLGGGPWSIFGSVVYGTSLVVLYAASTFYHSAVSPESKKVLQIVDHCCIYLLIAGSYTPFGIVIADGPLGQMLLAGIWAFAAVGIILKLIFGDRYPAISVTSYVIMGWMGAFAIQPLVQLLGAMPVILAIAGGLAYTLGVVFFPWKSIRHHHAIFHVFVLAGSILHYLAVLIYVVPFGRL